MNRHDNTIPWTYFSEIMGTVQSLTEQVLYASISLQKMMSAFRTEILFASGITRVIFTDNIGVNSCLEHTVIWWLSSFKHSAFHSRIVHMIGHRCNLGTYQWACVANVFSMWALDISGEQWNTALDIGRGTVEYSSGYLQGSNWRQFWISGYMAIWQLHLQ